MQPKKLVQSYNDGVAKIYNVKNVAEKGDQPKYEYDLKIDPLCYEERIVGMSRFYLAKQEDTKIERLLRFPKIDFVGRDDIVVLTDGRQYKIVQIQYPVNVIPKSMDLSLERLEVAYEVEGS